MPSTFNVMPIEGVNFKERFVPSIDRPASFALGTPAIGNSNDTWLYVQASGSVATGTCTVGPGTYLVTDAAGTYTADTAFLANEVGWVRLTASPFGVSV